MPREGPRRSPAARSPPAVAAAVARHGGMLTAADLAAYAPVWRQALRFDAFGWSFAAMPLPSSGGIILGQTLGLLERLGWPALPRFGADRAHLLTEAFRRAFADRFLLGDPSTTQATARAAPRSRPGSTPARPGSTRPRHPFGGGRSTCAAGTRRTAPEPTQTTHLSAIDAEGNLVALTTTLNGLFGCGLYVPEAGFFLNNEMDDFTAAPGRPNLFGLMQGEANAVAPGKRMLSSMTPTIAWRGAEAVALGGRGGSRIPTNVAQVLLALIADGDPLQTALDRPRLHHQWLPDRARGRDRRAGPRDPRRAGAPRPPAALREPPPRYTPSAASPTARWKPPRTRAAPAPPGCCARPPPAPSRSAPTPSSPAAALPRHGRRAGAHSGGVHAARGTNERAPIRQRAQEDPSA